METMNVKDFYFDLPRGSDRGSAGGPFFFRLLVLDKNTGETEHRHFRDITEYLRPGRLPGHQQYQGHSGPAVWYKEDTQAKIEVLY